MLWAYLYNIGLGAIFIDIASDISGVWISVVFGLFIFFTQFIFPIFIIYSKLIFEDKKIYTGFFKILNFFENSMIWILVVLLYIFTFFVSGFGFAVIFDKDAALVMAAVWVACIIFLQLLYFLFDRKSENLKILMPILIFFSWYLVCYLFFNLSNLLGSDHRLRVSAPFELIQFSNDEHSLFMVNKSFFERTGMSDDGLKFLLIKFSNLKDNRNIKNNQDNLYLYGSLVVNTKNIKILCPPDGFDEKNNPIRMAGSKVGTECIRFNASDLQNMAGLMPNQ
ncbi:hypothetical protein [Neisseria sp. S1]|uniref:hypothetical protein n=1 Tax=Neisseria sp. S1 TaxID=3318354 RepID=UPI003A87795D